MLFFVFVDYFNSEAETASFWALAPHFLDKCLNLRDFIHSVVIDGIAVGDKLPLFLPGTQSLRGDPQEISWLFYGEIFFHV